MFNVLNVFSAIFALFSAIVSLVLLANTKAKEWEKEFNSLIAGFNMNDIKTKIKPASKSYLFLKRIIDISISLFAIIIFSPIALFIIFVIKIESVGSVYNAVDRIGLNGKKFKTYTFQVYKSSNFYGKRLTKIGKILMFTGISHFPLFFNVLVGQMSIIGIRSWSIKAYKDLPSDMRDIIIRTKPGMSGLWTITPIRRKLSFRDLVYTDLVYMSIRSIWTDLLIMLKTAIVTLGFFSEI